MKPMIEYLNLSDDEYEMAKRLDSMPEEVRAMFLKLINTPRSEFKAAAKEVAAYIEQYKKDHK